MVQRTVLRLQLVEDLDRLQKLILSYACEQRLQKDPRQYGYHPPLWTVFRLCQEIERETKIQVHPRTVRRVIHHLRQKAAER